MLEPKSLTKPFSKISQTCHQWNVMLVLQEELQRKLVLSLV
jgi:hypothetical protein